MVELPGLSTWGWGNPAAGNNLRASPSAHLLKLDAVLKDVSGSEPAQLVDAVRVRHDGAVLVGERGVQHELGLTDGLGLSLDAGDGRLVQRGHRPHRGSRRPGGSGSARP